MTQLEMSNENHYANKYLNRTGVKKKMSLVIYTDTACLTSLSLRIKENRTWNS